MTESLKTERLKRMAEEAPLAGLQEADKVEKVGPKTVDQSSEG